VVIQAVERLRETCAGRGHPLLASLLDIAKAEAEDELRTGSQTSPRRSEIQKPDLIDSLEADLIREIAQLRRA
jgi:hypothetical protein